MQNQWMDALIFLAPPFVMCLILAGIHCYLGLHVLARGVIFVDLSLAQVAAFGATLAILFGFDHDSSATYFVSLASTFLAAALFAMARRHEKLFSQEAIIGIVYALASAAVVLVVDRVAHGAEHIKDLLVGQVLWVTWHDVLKTAQIYGVVSAVHYLFRKPLLAMVFDQMFHLTDEGWRKLTVRWALFFLALAVLNEIVWRTQSTDTWVAFKVFGVMPLTFVFAALQYPLLAKYDASKKS